jgi:hypothetical protein
MGTRHTYRIIETWTSNSPDLGQIEKPICLIYGQYDGYPDGRPLEVVKFTASGKFVNGYGADSPDLIFNGIGCYTAQLIAHLKDGTGNIYIQSLDSRLQSGEDYTYDIVYDFDTKKVTIKAYDWQDKLLFIGTPEEYISKYDKQD